MTRRVLIVMDDCGAGDALRLSFCVRAVRETLPDARLTLVVGEEAAAVYRSSPLVDRLVVSRLYRSSRAGRLAKVVELCRLMLAVGPGHDLVIVLWWGSAMLSLLARFAGKGRRVGFASRLRWLLSSRLGPYDFEGDEMVQNRLLLSAAGIPAAAAVPTIDLDREDVALADAALRRSGWDGARPLVLLHPGSDWACQQWPVDRWAGLADGLAEGGEVGVVFTGSAAEAPLVDRIRALMSQPAGSLAGQVSLAQMGAVVRRATLLVTVDSAVYLLGRSQGTPALVLAGPTHPERVAGVGPAPRILKLMGPRLELEINACKRPRYPAGGCQDWSCPMAGLREISLSTALDAARASLPAGRRRALDAGGVRG